MTFRKLLSAVLLGSLILVTVGATDAAPQGRGGGAAAAPVAPPGPPAPPAPRPPRPPAPPPRVRRNCELRRTGLTLSGSAFGRWTCSTPAKVSAKVITDIAVHMIQKLAMLSHWLYGARPRICGMA